MNTNALTLSPLFRQSIGFDRFNDLFEAALKGDERVEAYPPYNIEKLGEDNYRITMAVAGFSDADLTITAQGNALSVAGRIEQKTEKDGVEYLHRGIATRAFERKFSLADHVKVTGAALDHGLLQIELMREVPEANKPRMIEIATGAAQKKGKMIEGKASK